jgi:histidinol-phosphate aminotransferase|tara:strand:- start:310 stop:1362 length:1053 start_codon:yes stop_codon:yes gene_type:complete
MNKINIKGLARKVINDLKPYKTARDEYIGNGKKMILLDANENPFRTEFNRYPDPNQINLKNNISKIKSISNSKIFLSNGSNEVFNLLMKIFCEPGIDNIIICPPTFGMYEISAKINGINIKKIPLNSEFDFDVDMINIINKYNSKIIFIPSPNNPTGNCFSQKKIEMIINKFNGLVVLDEAYVDYSENKSFLPRLGTYKNLVITQTFSKAQGMAGIRLGMTFANEEIIELLDKIRAPYNVNSLTQKSAIIKLNQQEKVKKEARIILREKDKLIAHFKELKFIEKVFPSSANFILIRVDNSLKRYNQLIENNIVVRNTSYLFGCENTLRITVGLKSENDKLIIALKKINKL